MTAGVYRHYDLASGGTPRKDEGLEKMNDPRRHCDALQKVFANISIIPAMLKQSVSGILDCFGMLRIPRNDNKLSFVHNLWSMNHGGGI